MLALTSPLLSSCSMTAVLKFPICSIEAVSASAADDMPYASVSPTANADSFTFMVKLLFTFLALHWKGRSMSPHEWPHRSYEAAGYCRRAWVSQLTMGAWTLLPNREQI